MALLSLQQIHKTFEKGTVNENQGKDFTPEAF